MEQYQPHNNSIDPSLTAPQFFSTTPSASSSVPAELPPVVNLAPAQPPLPNQTSYDGMIMAAISALREKDGSSRQAIARYIERVYNNLPSNHSVLLTNHLKKLKNSGQITMVKHSYMLPSSGSANIPSTSPSPLYTTNPSYSFSPSPVMSLPPPQLFTNPITAAATTSTESAPPNQFMAQQFVAPFSTTEGVATSGVSSPPPSQPKKRGRPPKAKPDLPPAHNYGPGQAQFQPNGPDQTQFQNYGASNGLDQVQSYVGGPIGSVNVSDGPGEVSVKRRPGRPRKEKPIEAQYTLPTEAQQVPLPPGGAPIQPPAEAQNNPNAPIGDQVAGAGGGAQFVVQGNGAVSGSEAMLVSLGLSDDPSPAKMRPRRSPKTTIVEEPQAANGGKKRPGRPRKANPGAPGVYPVQVPVGTSPPVSSPGRGRPRKYAVAPGAVPNGAVNGGVNGIQMQPKKRGRKPKNVTQAAAFAVPVSFMLPEQMNAGGPVMMPQGTFGQAGVDAVSGGVVPGQVPMGGGYNGVVYQPMKRGRGRPPRTDGGLLPRKARKLSGKPLGRPRKNHTNSEDQSFEIVYLKTKLSYLQSKIKEAVPVIKAYLNGEEANAMGALGQLEELSTEDFGAALKAQNQQQPPAQHLQAEQQ